MDQDYKPSAGEHPITLPPELVQQWRATPEYTDLSEKLFLVTLTTKKLQDIATQAARWGADQELEACCKLLELSDSNAREFLTAARRPKPPSLKEQALAVITNSAICDHLSLLDEAILRRALEALND